MLIFENSIIGYVGVEEGTDTFYRVLWISPQQEEIVLIEINNPHDMKLPIIKKYSDVYEELNEGLVKILQIDPDIRIESPDPQYLERFKEQRDANWDVIKDIVNKEPDIYISKQRGKLIKEIVTRSGKSKKEVYRLLKRYWFYGKSINGLLGHYFDCGLPGETKKYVKKPGPKSKDNNSYVITEDDKSIFEKAVEEFYSKEKMTLIATHQHMCEKYYFTGFYRKYGVMVPIVEYDKIPTLRQFKYWFDNEYSKYEKYAKKHGVRKAHMDVRAFLGNPTERAIGIGYYYEIDSTPADIHLVSEDRKTVIGTPTLYIVKDVFSRTVVGFHVSLSNASTIEQMVALENAATNKVEFCRQYGIEIDEDDWPCFHLPRSIAGDRGELKSMWGENLVNLNVDIANAPSYRGDLKPYVERHFLYTNEEIRRLLQNAGAKPGRGKIRGEKDPAKDAALTIYEFTQFMILQTITFNKMSLNKKYFITREMFEDKVELSPLGVWKWGEKNRILHEVPQEILRYNLLPKQEATVTRWGIRFSGMYYSCDTAIKNGWFVDENIDGQKKVQICYDPRNVSSIFIRLKSGKFETCYLTQKYVNYENLHLEDVKAILRYQKDELDKRKKEEKQYQAEYHAFAANLKKEAIKKTQEADDNKSFYEKSKNKRAIKAIEARREASKNAWTNPEKNDKNIVDESATVLPFSKNGNHEFQNVNGITSVQEQFSNKNKERRRNRESLE